MSPRAQKVSAFIIGIFLLVCGSALMIPFMTYMRYDSLPVSNIGELGEDESGDLVKLEGTISRCDEDRLVISTQSTVTREHSSSGGTRTHVETDHYYVDEFWVEDSTGEVHVYTDSGEPIYFTNSEDYYVHNDIVVVGEFELSGTEKVLYLKAVSSSTRDFVSCQHGFEYLPYLLIIIGLTLIIVPVAMFVLARRKRKKASGVWHPPEGPGITYDTQPQQPFQPQQPPQPPQGPFAPPNP